MIQYFIAYYFILKLFSLVDSYNLNDHFIQALYFIAQIPIYAAEVLI